MLRTPRRACVRGEDYAAYRTEVLDIVKELHRAQLVSHAFSRCLEQHCRSRMGVPAFDGAAWCVFVCARWSARVCSSLPTRWCAERRDATSLSAQIVTPGAQIPGAQISLSCAPGRTLHVHFFFVITCHLCMGIFSSSLSPVATNRDLLQECARRAPVHGGFCESA